MAKQLLKERFQQLAGIKPLYEYKVGNHFAWRATEEEVGSQRSTIHHPHMGEYVSATDPYSLKAYEGDDRSIDPDDYSHIGKWPQNAKSFGEGDNGEERAHKWVEDMNKKAQELYAQVEEGGKHENDDYFKKLHFEQDEEGNIVKYKFITKSLYFHQTI
jgi:hypothetical protein